MRRCLWLAILCIACLAAVTQAGRLPRYGGGVRLQVFVPPSFTADPLQLWGDDAALVGACFYEGLLRWGPKNVEPGLATEWFHNEDHTRWLFHLRDDVHFHDGSRCDANAISESLHGLANRRLSNHAWILRDLVGWQDFSAGVTPQIEGIYILSPKQIELRLQRSVPDLAARLALPAAAITRRQGSAVFGTGPFRYALATEDSLHALPFDGCTTGRPFLDRLDFVADAPRNLALLRRTVSRADPLLAAPVGMARRRVPARRLALLLVHPASESLSDAAARQLVASRFDASVFVRAGLGGDGETALGFWPKISSVPPLEGSPSETTTGPGGAIRLLVPPDEPTLEKLGERFLLHLDRLGFDVDFELQSRDTYGQALGQGRFDIVLLGWTPLQGHPEDRREATRVLHLLSHLLEPVLGAEIPLHWRDMLEGRAAATEESLRQGAYLAPLVFFHDIWQIPDTTHDLHPSAVSPRLGLQDVHLHPSIP